MKITPIHSKIIKYGDELLAIIADALKSKTLVEGSIMVVTSKILSIIEGRLIAKNSISKEQLIKQEAEAWLEEKRYGIFITIKNGILIPSAGIDESNAGDYYILYPQMLWQHASSIWQYVTTHTKIRNFGVLITDSKSNIMRRGVTGIALAWHGFMPLYSYVGQHDIHQQPLRVTHANVADALAAAAVLVMGEGNAQTPIAIIENAPQIVFTEQAPNPQEAIVTPEEDLYQSLLKPLHK